MKKRLIATCLALLLMIPMAVPALAISNTPFEKFTKENVPVAFSQADFLANYRNSDDLDRPPLTHIQIVTIPAAATEGTLKVGTTTVSALSTFPLADMDKLVFTPALDASGKFDFEYKAMSDVSSPNKEAAPATISIVVSKILPIAKDITLTTPVNVKKTGTLQGSYEKNFDLTYLITGATTVNGVTSATTTKGGTVTQTKGVADPAFEYTPDKDYYGADTFTYTVKAADGRESAPPAANVTIYVGGAPTAYDQAVTVERNKSTVITLSATDPGGRVLSYGEVAKPKHGTLVPTPDGKPNQFTYTPAKDYMGADEFTFQASVLSGTVKSNIATVSITVAKYAITPMAYADMTTHWAATSAGSLAALGFVVGEEIQGKRYFRPDAPITRGDFILFLNAAMKITPSTDPVSVFSDNVPSWLIGPSNAAYKAGIVQGTLVGTKRHLKHDAVLTRLEAVTLIDRAMDLTSKTATLPTYADMHLVPNWGMQAVKNLSDYGILTGDAHHRVRPFDGITRGEAAELLFKSYKEKVLEGTA